MHRKALTTLETVTAGLPDHHVYEFTVAEAKAAGAMDVTDDRLPDEPPDHAVVLGITNSGPARRLRDVARRVWPA